MEYDKTHKNNNTNSANKIPPYAPGEPHGFQVRLTFF